ncbi:hypothetical protein OESDEN_16894 [Oesophagostomum dentatum]|uniref:Uncharacterized protein n=1 Tax=Oesophagostomum dentatum TaxID=61180 RepID=A0A0B1SEP2_OESDE|nr:hypothetical protein OESDEN_16894 [Oesophagostomum dentatum]
MTRKRKIDTVTDSSDGDKKNRLAGYGYQSFSEEASASVPNFRQNRTFPRKGDFRERGDDLNGRGHFREGDYSRNDGSYDAGQESGNQEEKDSYPSELVAYLKNIEQLKLSEGRIEDIVMDKCAEECSGEEEKLLLFRDSCVVVENVFG